MADTVKGTVEKAGHRVEEAAEKVADWVKEKAHETGHAAREGAREVKHAVAGTGTQDKSEDSSGSCGCG
jgi:hypothetical protein